MSSMESIEAMVNEHEKKLEKHDNEFEKQDKRIKDLENSNSEMKVEIKNLCDSLKKLTSALWWFICALISGFISFLFYILEKKLL